MSNLLLVTSVIPFDPSIDTALGHRNLVLIYIVVWASQMAYAIYAVRSLLASSRPSIGDPTHDRLNTPGT